MAVDYVLKKMERDHIPMTRENYLDIAFMGNPPDPLSAEQEADLPEQFQLQESEENHAGLNALTE